MNNILLAFFITLCAGLSTVIGSIISLFVKKENKTFLSISLGFSAGVMIYISMLEMFLKSKDLLTSKLGEFNGYFIAIMSFFVGIVLVLIIDLFLDKKENKIKEENSNYLYKVGLFTAFILALHNFPEGFVTFVSSLYNPTMGIVIAVAIAIHNIPEGIAVSVPIYYSTGNRKKAFIYSFLSGLTEPLGAIIGYIILGTFLNELAFGIVFALTAGIMVYISISELLPSAFEYGNKRLSIYGFILGMFIMAISLLLFI